MFTLCRLRAVTVPLARANSTLESLSSTTTSIPRNPKYPPIRPSICLERPREWNRPVAPGIIPAYDEAVAYIRADAAALQAEADTIRLNLENQRVQTDSIEEAKAKLNVLDIMARVNLPEVRWKAANGMGLCFHSTCTNCFI
jgi:large subunit ribosomal protein L35